MAFSQALEEVIEAALADGVLTDKERAVLHKRAAQEGIDPDELDVVIEGRLAKMKRETDWLKPAPPASEKRGNIVKCPSCGAPIEAGAVSCKECGYVFTNVAANRSSEKLAEKISFLLHSKANENHIVEEIKNFPLPTGKEDLMEFIASMDAKRKEQGPLQQAYRAKFNESITKAKTFFSNDAQVMGMVKALDKFSVSSLTKMQKILAVSGIAAIILIAIISISSYNNSIESEAQCKAAQVTCDSLCKLIDELPMPTRENCDEAYAELRKITWTSPEVTWENDSKSIKNAYLDKKNAYAKQLKTAYDNLWEKKNVRRDRTSTYEYRNTITGEIRTSDPKPGYFDLSFDN